MLPMLISIALAILLLPLEVEVMITQLTKDKFQEWLKLFRQQKGVGLFGILLIGHSDSIAGEVVKENGCRRDIAEFSAEDCWFIYFTEDIDEPQEQRNLHEQHAMGTTAVAKWLGLDISEMPCFVFFERPEYDDYLYIGLQGKSKEELMREIREMFNHVREQKKSPNYSTFQALRTYKRTRDLQRTGRSFLAFVHNTALTLTALVFSQQ